MAMTRPDWPLEWSLDWSCTWDLGHGVVTGELIHGWGQHRLLGMQCSPGGLYCGRCFLARFHLSIPHHIPPLLIRKVRNGGSTCASMSCAPCWLAVGLQLRAAATVTGWVVGVGNG